jgi:ankyrin repeat protein
MNTDTILEAVKAGDAERVRALLDQDPRLADARSPTGEPVLMTAVYRGRRDLAAALLAAGASVDVFASAALGDVGRLRALLTGAASASPYAHDGWTPLHLASFFGHRESAAMLLDAGADAAAVSRNSMRNTPLHAAVAGGHVEVALLLIDRGAPVSVPDAGGHTPLHIAADNGLLPVVEALLARGADPLAVDAEQMTPLARAAARNHNAIIDALNR